MSLFQEQNHKNQCGYGLCFCTVQEGEIYCSLSCRQAAEQAVERLYCQCGDPHCRETAEMQSSGPLFSFREAFEAHP